ncbi:peptide deformylase [Synechococcus sp. PCC 7336]|uniref:peptide deformylase n=1 Tax=Synechococcus sp. PCC 7336 TaxID=195250 RepID=UPI000347F023|nr:peptide deformylase [Synechococcus sp. PCC 7336]
MPTSVAVPKTKLKRPPLNIHTLGDRVLRQPAKRVSKIDNSIRDLARQMLQTMYSSDGIGLAAPQVGIHKRLIVVDCKPDDPKAEPLVLINPQILEHSDDAVLGEEGCLSIPEVFLNVKRPTRITVTYKDERGRPHRLKTDGLLARVIQHEIDHLNGIVFVDRVENDIQRTQELQSHGFNARDVVPLTAA